MRHALLPLLTLSLLLTACGGGGTERPAMVSDQIQRLNEHELLLTGAYDLSGFLIQEDGVWKTGDQVEAWSGRLFLAYDHQASLTIELEGELRMLTGTWSADAGYVTFDGEFHGDVGRVAAWALTDDGVLQTSFVQANAGDDAATWLWRKTGS